MQPRRVQQLPLRASAVFDCIQVSPYDIVPVQQAPMAQEVGKVLSRIGSLVNQWILHARRIFHLLIALAFMFLTLLGVSVTYTEWEAYRQAPQQGYVHLAMFGGFTIFLAILCLYSFAKARSVR